VATTVGYDHKREKLGRFLAAYTLGLLHWLYWIYFCRARPYKKAQLIVSTFSLDYVFYRKTLWKFKWHLKRSAMSSLSVNRFSMSVVVYTIP